MKLNIKQQFCLFLVLFLLVTPQFAAHARSHRFLDLQIDARVGADGVVRVIEKHKVQFDGTFSGMYQWIDTRKGIEVRNVVISESGIPYTKLDGDSPGPTGTYYIQTKKDEIYVDWSFNATDETRTFELSYILDNVILKHEDVAEFYYQFVGKQWEDPRDHVRIALSLPQGASLDEIGAWGHGPLHGTVSIEGPNQVVWEINSLPSRTFVEGRVVFPTRLVPGATRRTNQLGLPGILAEEAGKIEEVQRAQQRKKIDPYLAMVVLVLAYPLVVYIWHNYMKPYPGFKEQYYKELPAGYSPAELAILYRRNVYSRDLTATLLDLARRGFFTIEEIIGLQGRAKKDEFTYQFIQKDSSEKDMASLRIFEKRIIQFLFEDIGSERVTLEDIQQYAKKNSKDFADFWSTWSKEVKKVSMQHLFFDEKSKKQVLWFLLPGFAVILLSILPVMFNLYITGAVSLMMGFVIIIAVGIATARRSPQGNIDYTKWKAFRRYLKHFSRVETTRVGSLGIWEYYLPYAVTLGVADQLFKQLEVAFPNFEEDGYHFGSGWFMYHHVAGVNRISHMTNTVDKSFSSATTSINAGSGGGFSSGGGGGFGGGGGGVR